MCGVLKHVSCGSIRPSSGGKGSSVKIIAFVGVKMPNKAPRKPRVVEGTQRQKVWLAMQIKGKFCLSDLCRCVLTGAETAKFPRNNISCYVKSLSKVGVLVQMKRRMAQSANIEKRWLLVRDLGRKAPVVCPNGDVYDPNSGNMLPRSVTEAEDSHEQPR